MSKYSNKRLHMRTSGGRFRKAVPADLGIGGVCDTCGHFLLRHYDGDERERPIDPRRIRYRCFTCEPRTEAELALAAEIEAEKPQQKPFLEWLDEAAAKLEQ